MLLPLTSLINLLYTAGMSDFQMTTIRTEYFTVSNDILTLIALPPPACFPTATILAFKVYSQLSIAWLAQPIAKQKPCHKIFFIVFRSLKALKIHSTSMCSAGIATPFPSDCVSRGHELFIYDCTWCNFVLPVHCLAVNFE